MCVATTDAPVPAATARYSGSAKPLMSLPSDAPAAVAARAAPSPARCVDAERDVEAGVQGLDGGDDLLQFLLLAHLGPRSCLHAADVEQAGAVGDELVGLAQEVVEGEVATLVEEGVRCPVEDAHHERTVRDVETCYRGRRPASRTLTVARRKRATSEHHHDTDRRPCTPQSAAAREGGAGAQAGRGREAGPRRQLDQGRHLVRHERGDRPAGRP